jgi:putative ABC transport system substrate-binding protein
MRRRNFVAMIAGSAISLPLAIRAQQVHRVRHIGILTGRADPESLNWQKAFNDRLKQLGWTDGDNIRIDIQADGDVTRWQARAREMVDSGPDLIVVIGNPGVEALRQETRTIPVVFLLVGDPVGSGYVASLARPGGNRPDDGARTGFALAGGEGQY